MSKLLLTEALQMAIIVLGKKVPQVRQTHEPDIQTLYCTDQILLTQKFVSHIWRISFCCVSELRCTAFGNNMWSRDDNEYKVQARKKVQKIIHSICIPCFRLHTTSCKHPWKKVYESQLNSYNDKHTLLEWILNLGKIKL